MNAMAKARREAPLMSLAGSSSFLCSPTTEIRYLDVISAPVMMRRSETSVSNNPSAERHQLRSLRDRFVKRLRDMDIEIALITPTDIPTHPANANIRFVGINAQDILQSVQPRVAASTGSACTSGTPEPSHVLRALGLTEQEAKQCIRFSMGRDTTETDVEEAAVVIAEAVRGLSLALRSTTT